MTAAEPTTVTPPEFHRFLIGAIKQVQALPLARYEEPGADRGRLLAQVRSLLQVSLEILDIAVDHYEQVADGERPTELAPGKLCSEVDRRMAGPEAHDIADLAFVARLGLRGRLQALEALRGDDARWEIIDEAGSACREILKSLSAIEHAVAELEGLDSDNSYYQTGLMGSLATRRTYAAFAGDVVRDGPATEETVIRRLRLTATAIAKLTGREVYPDLRVADRIQFRSLQERILEWLRQDPEAQGVLRAGMRLWQDVEAFAQLLRQVNHRAELRAHDGERLAEALAALEAAADAGERWAPDPVLAGLAELRGLDDELDGWLDPDGEPVLLEACVARLRTLHERIAREAPARPEPGADVDPTLVEGDFL